MIHNFEAEYRDKYSADERDKAAEAGEAMSGGSYPVKDRDDLKKAIKAVGRGNADHDAIRKHIIARAKALKLSSLIPDNWESDGSLKEENSVWATLEERETYNDARQTVESAISDSLPKKKSGIESYVYVMDMTDAWAVYEYEGDLWQVDYTLGANGDVTLGTKGKVRRVTTYEKNAAPVGGETREEYESCPVCEGTGSNNGEPCSNCEGTGKVEAEGPGEQSNSDKAELEARERVREMLSGTLERRDFKADVEIRETSDGGLRFSGYASTTETPYEVGPFQETFARGAFKRCLGEEPDVVLLVNHEGLPLARTRSGTMTVSEDTRGLKVDADLDPTDPDVQALVPKMKRGDLTEMSFAFRATDEDWTERNTKRLVRSATIHKGDVSMVTHGANSTTSGTLKFRAEESGLEIRMDERIGKKHSKATEAEIDAAIEHLEKLRPKADPEPEAEPVLPGATLVPFRSSVDAERSERAKVLSGAR